MTRPTDAGDAPDDAEFAQASAWMAGGRSLLAGRLLDVLSPHRGARGRVHLAVTNALRWHGGGRGLTAPSAGWAWGEACGVAAMSGMYATARAVAYIADLYEVRVGDLGPRWAGDVEYAVERAELSDSLDAMVATVRRRLAQAGITAEQADHWFDTPDARLTGAGTDYSYSRPTPREVLEDGDRRLVDWTVTQLVEQVAPVADGSSAA